MKIRENKRWWIALAFAIVAAFALGLVLILSSASRSAGANPGLRIQPTGTVQDEKAVPPTPVHPYETAQDVAKVIGCTNYTDLGPAPLGGVYSHGHCTLHGTRMSIDTFCTEADKKAWLQVAVKLGVQPQWESATSVTYPALDK
jgi:hypothetical protein